MPCPPKFYLHQVLRPNQPKTMTTNAKFGEHTEGKDVVDAFPNAVRGKTILITGASPNGLGGAMANVLAMQSPSLLILAGRNATRVLAIIREIAVAYPSVKTRALIFDMSSFESIKAAAKEVLAYPEPSIDIVINNAGIMNIATRTLSADGFEMHLAVNYLGVFLFTNSIMPKILTSKAPRITNVSTDGHVLSPFRFADYNFDEEKSGNLPEDQQPSKEKCKAFGLPWGLNYLPLIAYGQSKTALMLYTRELAAKLKDKNVVANCCHPGAIKTVLWREIPKDVCEGILNSIPMKTMSQGVSTPLVCALDPKLKDRNGAYLSDCKIKDPSPWASDARKAQELWVLSEKLTGKSFSF